MYLGLTRPSDTEQTFAPFLIDNGPEPRPTDRMTGYYLVYDDDGELSGGRR